MLFRSPAAVPDETRTVFVAKLASSIAGKSTETLPWDDEPASTPASKAKPAPAPTAKTQEVADAFDELFK